MLVVGSGALALTQHLTQTFAPAGQSGKIGSAPAQTQDNGGSEPGSGGQPDRRPLDHGALPVLWQRHLGRPVRLAGPVLAVVAQLQPQAQSGPDREPANPPVGHRRRRRRRRPTPTPSDSTSPVPTPSDSGASPTTGASATTAASAPATEQAVGATPLPTAKATSPPPSPNPKPSKSCSSQ